MKRVSVVVEFEIDTNLEVDHLERVLRDSLPSGRIDGMRIRSSCVEVQGETEIDGPSEPGPSDRLSPVDVAAFGYLLHHAGAGRGGS